LDVQTLWYRAPELFFGDLHFGTKADMWSVGLVLAELAGAVFHKNTFSISASQVAYCHALFRFLGTPVDAVLSALPLFPSQPPRFPRVPWSPHVHHALGSIGIDMLDDLLKWDPGQRPDATRAWEHTFLHPHRFVLGGMACRDGISCGLVPLAAFEGARHKWNVLTGVLDVGTLRWLQEDPALVPGTPEHIALALDFNTTRKNVKTEENRKFILAGALSQCSSVKMCALSVETPLPLPRVLAWFAAFRGVNAAALADLRAAAVAAVRKLEAKDVAENGQHFLQTPFDQWLLTCGELCITKAGDSATGFWQEPRHQDGGASVLHMGLTLFGRRTVLCEQGDGLPDVAIECLPGGVYIGGFTGPHHQVAHQPARPAELMEGMSVSVMMRTALFPHNRSRTRGTTPSPQEFFRTLAASFRESLAAGSWVLPSRSDCESGGLESASMPPPAVPSPKRARHAG
jgi:hypothetical protein